MKQKVFLPFLFTIASFSPATAQWHNDSPTPAETALYDRPYLILQQQIQNKICNADWGIQDKGFFLLQNDPEDRHVIVRGAGIHHFSVSRYGNSIHIELKNGSPFFRANSDSASIYTKIQIDDMKLIMQMMKAAAANNYKTMGAVKKSADSLQSIDKNASLKSTHFTNEKAFADVGVDINMNWTGDLGFVGGYSVLNNNLHVAGADKATLYADLPDKDKIDTFYVADLYFGNWPQPPVKKALPFHFKYNTSYGWADKAHSGTPFIENMIIHVAAYHYNNLFRILREVDWSKLDAVVKK